MSNSRKAGRNVKSGRFVPVEKARANPKHSVVEHLPLPGKSPKSTTTVGRNAGNGEFTTVEKARNNPGTHEVTKIPKKS